MLHRTAHMSRDQFSQLMLVYTGMAADIAEIFEVLTDEADVLGFDKYSVFEAFRESKVMINSDLTYAILAVWNWSLLQFCLAIGASHKARKSFGWGEQYLF